MQTLREKGSEVIGAKFQALLIFSSIHYVIFIYKRINFGMSIGKLVQSVGAGWFSENGGKKTEDIVLCKWVEMAYAPARHWLEGKPRGWQLNDVTMLSFSIASQRAMCRRKRELFIQCIYQIEKP